MDFLARLNSNRKTEYGENDFAVEFTFRDERRDDRSFQAGQIPLIRCSNQFRKDFISGRDITPFLYRNEMERLGQEESWRFEKPPSEIASASRCSRVVLPRNSSTSSSIFATLFSLSRRDLLSNPALVAE